MPPVSPSLRLDSPNRQPMREGKRRSFKARPLLAALTLSLGSLFLSPAFGQTNLAQSVLIASEFDPGLTALRHEVARKGVDIESARDEGRPQFGLSAESSTTGSDGPAVVLTVSQVIFDWGRVKAGVDSATQERIMALADLKRGTETLAMDVARYFIDIEAYRGKVAITQNYLAFAERIFDHARARAEAGRGDRGEQARAALEVTRTKDQLEVLRSDMDLAIAQLEFLMGRNPGALTPSPDLNFAARYAKGEEIAKIVTLAPEYITAQAELGQAEAGVTLAKAARLPSIKLQAQVRSDLERGNSRSAVGISAGVDVGMGAISGRQTQAAAMEVEGRKANLAAIKRNLINGVNTALDQIAVLRRREASQQAQLAQTDTVLESYEQQFVAGQRELLDLLTTGRDQYDAQIDSVDTSFERKLTEYEAAYDLGVLGTMINAN